MQYKQTIKTYTIMTERVHFSEILVYNSQGIKYVPMGEEIPVLRSGKIVSIKDNFMVLEVPVIGENLYDGCYAGCFLLHADPS